MSAQNHESLVGSEAKAWTGLLNQSGSRFCMVCFGQNAKGTLPFNINFFMSLSKLASMAALVLFGGVLLALPTQGLGQTNYYAANGGQDQT